MFCGLVRGHKPRQMINSWICICNVFWADETLFAGDVQFELWLDGTAAF